MLLGLGEPGFVFYLFEGGWVGKETQTCAGVHYGELYRCEGRCGRHGNKHGGSRGVTDVTAPTYVPAFCQSLRLRRDVGVMAAVLRPLHNPERSSPRVTEESPCEHPLSESCHRLHLLDIPSWFTGFEGLCTTFFPHVLSNLSCLEGRSR